MHEIKSREEFAELASNYLIETGVDGACSFDIQSFALSFKDEQGRPRQRIALENFYREFVSIPSDERQSVLQRMLALSRQMVDYGSYADIEPNLTLAIYDRWRITFSVLDFDQRMRQLSEPHTNITGFMMGDVFCSVPTIDQGTSKQVVHTGHYSHWSKTYDEVNRIAQLNLIEKTKSLHFELHEAKAGSDNRFYLAREDDYAASHVLYISQFNNQKVLGERVAFLPLPNRLLITGSKDLFGLMFGLTELEQSRNEPHALPPFPLICRGEEFFRFKPLPSEPLYERFHLLETDYFGQIYAQQREQLLSDFDQLHEDTFVASFARVGASTGAVRSVCTLTLGVPTLLPQTDAIMFAKVVGETGSIVAQGKWSRVSGILGNKLKPTNHYPPRFMVNESPTEQELLRIGKEEIF